MIGSTDGAPSTAREGARGSDAATDRVDAKQDRVRDRNGGLRGRGSDGLRTGDRRGFPTGERHVVGIDAGIGAARVNTDPIDHEPPVDPMESGTGLSVVSLADADTAGTRDPSPWKAGDPLPDYIQQALSHGAAVVDPASLSRLAATRGVEVWMGAGSGELAGQTCIVAAQSQLPVAETSCAAPAEFEANGASALLRLPNGSQAIEARVLPERAKGTGVAEDTWEAVNDRILLLAKPPTADAGELRVPTRDGSAPILVRPMG